MNTVPAPRPALRKAADAHVHPAAPGRGPHLLRHPPAGPAPAPEPTEAPLALVPEPGGAVPAAAAREVVGGLSRPPGGTTSDSLRRAGRRAGDRKVKLAKGDKKVKLTVEIPKSLRTEFQAALKADRKKADAVVAGLLRTWLDG
jgi:hypothetical protein